MLVNATEGGIRVSMPGLAKRKAEHDGVTTDIEAGIGGELGSSLFYQLSLHPNLRNTPACFLEVAFMDNPKVEDVLFREGKWKTTMPPVAEAIGKALIDWHRKSKPKP